MQKILWKFTETRARASRARYAFILFQPRTQYPDIAAF
jgi:hypothetical protein